MKSKTQQGHVDMMIDLGIAFESFFLRGISQEMTFRFSLRGSLYLGDDLEQRGRIKKDLSDSTDTGPEPYTRGPYPTE